MIDRMLLESNQLPEKPELGILLKGCVTDAERKAVHEAFYTFAQGDPGGLAFSSLFCSRLMRAS
jgi:hypothetical protein